MKESCYWKSYDGMFPERRMAVSFWWRQGKDWLIGGGPSAEPGPNPTSVRRCQWGFGTQNFELELQLKKLSDCK